MHYKPNERKRIKQTKRLPVHHFVIETEEFRVYHDSIFRSVAILEKKSQWKELVVRIYETHQKRQTKSVF